MSLAEIFFAKHPPRTELVHRRRRRIPPRRRRLLFEPLEPRLLLDALPLPLTVDMPPLQADLTVRLDDGGQNVQVVEAKTASVVAEQPLSNTSEVVVRGTAGDDRLTIDASVPASLPIRFSGGLGADTLVGPNTDSTWVVTWPDEGHVGSVAFSEVEHLVGAPDNEAS